MTVCHSFGCGKVELRLSLCELTVFNIAVESKYRLPNFI